MRNSPIPFAALALLTLAAPARAAAPAPEAPDTFPACSYPQPITGLQTAGGGHVGGRTAIVWNGKDYATVYADATDNALHFRRFFADGTPVAAAVTVSTAQGAYAGDSPALLWNGNGYAVAWSSNETQKRIYFALLNAGGGVTSGPTLVIDTSYPNNFSQPALAMGGGRYLVSYSYFFGGADYDLFATLLDATGVVTNMQLGITYSGTYDERYSSAAWNSTVSAFQLVWREISISGPTSYRLNSGQVTPGGSVAVNAGILFSGTNQFNAPSLTNAGTLMGLTYEYLNPPSQIYFGTLGSNGAIHDFPVKVSNTVLDVVLPRVVWTGGEYAIFWSNYSDIWMQRVSTNIALLGGNVQATTSGFLNYPDAAFGKSGFMITGAPYAVSSPYGPNFLQSLGCTSDSTPPSCPGNFFAYNITGTSATIAWSPSSDNETDLAYYQVYRNDAPLAKTTDAFYNDSGLSLSTTYNYMIQPVNAAQLQNTACTASMYLKTNASLTLTMNKSNPDAVLNWTDAGFNNYNVFRGNDPRVMQQIGSTPSLTTQDSNVLSDNLNYFYTVDDPGL